MSEHTDQLKGMYKDMVGAYQDAKLNDNVPGQERIVKLIRDLVKQIKDQELHEREVIPRKEAERLFSRLGVMVGAKLKDRFGDDAADLITDIVVDGHELIEQELEG